uniref:Uncharacterized protein n=1 Tax=Oryza punctata TaxID=4537 RepID=A0A0E0MFD9_ORYPU
MEKEALHEAMGTSLNSDHLDSTEHHAPVLAIHISMHQDPRIPIQYLGDISALRLSCFFFHGACVASGPLAYPGAWARSHALQ